MAIDISIFGVCFQSLFQINKLDLVVVQGDTHFRQSTQGHRRIAGQHLEHGRQVAVLEFESGALQVIVIGEDLFGPLDVLRRAFDLDGISQEINGYIESVFQQPQVFIPRSKKRLNVWGDIYDNI